MISVVLPVYNEAENLDVLVGRLREVLERAAGSGLAMVFVDDGSTDASPDMLNALAARDPRCKVIHFSRNFGHQAALQAGLDAAVGDAVVIMDADLQDPPEVLARLIAKWREGYDVVYAIRRRRKGGLLKRALDAAKLRRETGWEPAHSFEESLDATIEWYRTHEAWWRAVKSGEYRRFYDLWYGSRLAPAGPR